MTCIVGVKHKGGVVIGGDSAGVSGLDLVVRSDRKVFVKGDYVMGFTTSFRMGQLLHHALTVPVCYDGMDLEHFMVTSFVNAVRDCLKSGGFASKDKEEEQGGCFVVGYKGRLFTIEGDYQVGEAVDSFTAVGCGAKFALGSLCETENLKPKDRVQRALNAAERYSAGVRKPFHIVEGSAA